MVTQEIELNNSLENFYDFLGTAYRRAGQHESADSNKVIQGSWCGLLFLFLWVSLTT